MVAKILRLLVVGLLFFVYAGLLYGSGGAEYELDNDTRKQQSTHLTTYGSVAPHNPSDNGIPSSIPH